LVRARFGLCRLDGGAQLCLEAGNAGPGGGGSAPM